MRKFRYAVQIRSKPGMPLPYHSMIVVVADTERGARHAAIAKVKKTNPAYRYRTESCWIIDSITEVSDA